MEDPHVVALHIMFVGTLILGFIIFLAQLILILAILILAGAARLLALAAVGLLCMVPAASPSYERPSGTGLVPSGRSPGAAEAAAGPPALNPAMNSVRCPLQCLGLAVRPVSGNQDTATPSQRTE